MSGKDSAFNWIYVGAVFILNFCMALSLKAWGILYLMLLERFQESATLTAWPMSICHVVLGVCGNYV